MTTPETGGSPPVPGTSRTWLRAVPTFFRAAAFAAGTLPTWAAVALYAAALAAAALGTPLPVTTFVAAFAAGASLPRSAAPRGIVAVSLLWAAGLLLQESVDVPFRATAVMAIAFAVGAATVGGRREELGVTVEDARAGFLVAAQRHPWVCTVVVTAAAISETVVFCEGSSPGTALFGIGAVIPLVGLHAAVHLTARSPSVLGRLAPLAVGIPPAAVLSTLVWYALHGGDDWHDAALPVLAGLGCVGLVVAYLTARRAGDLMPAVGALAILAAFAAGWLAGTAWDAGSEAALVGVAAAGPLALAAGARLSSRPAIAVAVTAACAYPILGLAVLGDTGPDPPRWGAWGRDAPDPAVDVLVRSLSAGAAWIALCTILRAARSMSALSYDHPVFTEGPYVRAARDAAARAEVASPS